MHGRQAITSSFGGDERMQRVFAYRSFIDAAAPAGRQGLHGRPSVAGHPIAPANLPSIGRGCLIFQKATRIKQRRGRRIMVIPKLPKLEPWVRFPSPAPLFVVWRVPALP